MQNPSLGQASLQSAVSSVEICARNNGIKFSVTDTCCTLLSSLSSQPPVRNLLKRYKSITNLRSPLSWSTFPWKSYLKEAHLSPQPKLYSKAENSQKAGIPKYSYNCTTRSFVPNLIMASQLTYQLLKQHYVASTRLNTKHCASRSKILLKERKKKQKRST